LSENTADRNLTLSSELVVAQLETRSPNNVEQFDECERIEIVYMKVGSADR